MVAASSSVRQAGRSRATAKAGSCDSLRWRSSGTPSSRWPASSADILNPTHIAGYNERNDEAAPWRAASQWLALLKSDRNL